MNRTRRLRPFKIRSEQAFSINFRTPWFTLVELIVVITILAILATVGFLSLSGYSDDARTATVKANVRTVYSAILTESTTTGNSPRYYVNHDATAALFGAFVFVDGKQLMLTWGNLGEAPADSNYSAGNPRWDRLRMNGEKFKLAFAGPEGLGMADLPAKASAAYSSTELAVGAVDVFKVGVNGRKRATPFFQISAVVPGTKTAVVTGNYSTGSSSAVSGLIRDPSSSSPSAGLVDGAQVPNVNPPDPYYSTGVALLMHFDGPNGSQSLVDAKGGTSVANGTSGISSASKKFGDGSLWISNGSYVTYPAGVTDFWSSDFTFEYFLATTNPGGKVQTFDNRPLTTNGPYLTMGINYPSSGLNYYTNTTNAITCQSDAIPADSSWHHVAYSKIGTTGRLFIDGKLAGTWQDSNAYPAGAVLRSGWNAFNVTPVGDFYLDELRITKGVGRYSSEFVPPTLPFPEY